MPASDSVSVVRALESICNHKSICSLTAEVQAQRLNVNTYSGSIYSLKVYLQTESLSAGSEPIPSRKGYSQYYLKPITALVFRRLGSITKYYCLTLYIICRLVYCCLYSLNPTFDLFFSKPEVHNQFLL